MEKKTKTIIAVVVVAIAVVGIAFNFIDFHKKEEKKTIYVDDDDGNIYIMNTHKDTVVKFIKMGG